MRNTLAKIPLNPETRDIAVRAHAVIASHLETVTQSLQVARLGTLCLELEEELRSRITEMATRALRALVPGDGTEGPVDDTDFALREILCKEDDVPDLSSPRFLD